MVVFGTTFVCPFCQRKRALRFRLFHTSSSSPSSLRILSYEASFPEALTSEEGAHATCDSAIARDVLNGIRIDHAIERVFIKWREAVLE